LVIKHTASGLTHSWVDLSAQRMKVTGTKGRDLFSKQLGITSSV